MQDEELLEKLHNEPNLGMKQLMDQYAGLVFAVVKGKLSSVYFCDADWEACVADTFSEFYFDLDKYHPVNGSIKTWLCMIARNNALDYMRKHQKEKGLLSFDNEGMLKQCEDDFSIEGEFEDRQLRLELIAAIKELGEPDCGILVRKFYLSQTSKEIAEQLGMTVSNVDTRTHRAIQKLRKRFGGERV